MKRILLPELIRIDKIGKNVIKHKLFEGGHFECALIEVGENHLLLKNQKGEPLCIVQKNKNYCESVSRILVADKKPLLENVCELNLSWLKYPGLNESFDPEHVRETWIDTFSFKEEDIENNIYGLRKPQIAAIFNILSHWRIGGEIGTVVMPTGTGKTETMLSLLIAQRCKKVLIIVPTDPLREQISDKFLMLGHLQNHQFGIVSPSASKPIVGILNENFKTTDELQAFLDQCNVVVTTMDLITSGSLELQRTLATGISNVFIDEAHHVKAPTWLKFRRLFDPEKE